jgi:hypothetical protein
MISSRNVRLAPPWPCPITAFMPLGTMPPIRLHAQCPTPATHSPHERQERMPWWTASAATKKSREPSDLASNMNFSLLLIEIYQTDTFPGCAHCLKSRVAKGLRLTGDEWANRFRHLQPLTLAYLQRGRDLRNAPRCAGLNLVPELFAVGQGVRHPLGQQHLGLHDAAPGGEVVAAIDPVVPEPRGRPAGGSRNRTGARRPPDDLHVEAMDRHDAAICATGPATSERRICAPALEKISGGTGPSRAVPATLEPFGRGAGNLIASTA